MKDTWDDMDTGEVSLQESEHHTKERRTHQNWQVSERTRATPIM